MLELLRSWVFPSACEACDRPGPALCAACAPAVADAIHFAIDGIPATALGAYQGPLRDAILAMKRGARDPLVAFAQLLDAVTIEGVLVPLPTTAARAAERGFDQSIALARAVAARRALSWLELLDKHGPPQAGRGREGRLASSGRFRLKPGVALPPTVTLLDDVCTTGATIRDAVALLRTLHVSVERIILVARSETQERAQKCA